MPTIHCTEPQRPRKRSVPLQGLFFILLLIFGSYALLSSSFFSLSKITIQGNKQLASPDIIRLSGVTLGTNIFKIKLAAAEKNIGLHPLVKTVKAERKLPRGLEIKVTERVGQGILPHQGGFLVIDSEAVYLYPVASIEKVNLPIITGVKIGKVKAGEKIPDKELVDALYYLSVMGPEISSIVSEINCTDSENIIMYTIDGIEIRFGSSENAVEKLRIYSEVIAQKYNQRIQYIDLSYQNKPVVKFLPESE